MTRLRVVDIETTGSGRGAEVVEFGRVDVVAQDGAAPVLEPTLSWLYRPLRPVPPEIMAIHHLTEQDLHPGLPVATVPEIERAVWSGEPPDALVAHNCEFERAFITNTATRGLPWICTYKVALRLWPEAPRHSNQVLRYWRGHRLDPALAMPPHRAGPDAYVTAHLLAEMLTFASAGQMIEWTAQPRLLPKVPFGKHKGSPWKDVPTDYLDWMIAQTDMDADTQARARQERAAR